MTRRRCHSHYETLRVDRRAPPERVRAAYRRLAQKFHPDKHAGKSAAAAVMAAINQAYEVLCDPSQRAGYDDWLAAEEARAAPCGGTAAVFVPDRFGWAGWLLWAIVSIAVLTVGFVVIRIKTQSPAPAPLSAPALAGQPAPAAAQPQAAPAVQPRTRTARTALPPNPETDPVTRLVRDGTIDQASARRNPGTP